MHSRKVMEMINANIGKVLAESKTVAVVGISDKPGRASGGVAKTLLRAGYEVIPVNPMLKEWEGRTVYPDLASVPVAIDIVDIFRRSDQVAEVVDEAIAVGAKTVWMQLGVVDEASAQKALDAGLNVVMDRCMAIELG